MEIQTEETSWQQTSPAEHDMKELDGTCFSEDITIPTGIKQVKSPQPISIVCGHLKYQFHSLCTPVPEPTAHLPSTAFVSSSLSNSPRFRIAPALGASSLGFAASAFLYAVCNARTLVACFVENNQQSCSPSQRTTPRLNPPPSCDANTRSNPPALEDTSVFLNHHPSRY
jgi:hypothetical protein